jgi:ubiquinone/menaquinone biosynthesis C-methylase UbiE
MSVFDLPENVRRYEAWFSRNRAVFDSEIEAIQKLLPPGIGLEIGTGTGLFAQQLGIRTGSDPSMAMLTRARERRIQTCRGTGERLPFCSACFDFALMVTTICFLEDPAAAFRECRRVLQPNGALVIGFIDGESSVGKLYREKANRSLFYREATFYTADQVKKMLVQADFEINETCQTLFGNPDTLGTPQTPEYGTGKGSFVVIRGKRRNERHPKTI